MSALPVRSRYVASFVTLRRSVTNNLVTGVAIVSTALVLVPLVAILGYLLHHARHHQQALLQLVQTLLELDPYHPNLPVM